MKKFVVAYYEYSVLSIEIEAESVEEAQTEFENMAENGEIDFTDADVLNTELKVKEIKENEEL